VSRAAQGLSPIAVKQHNYTCYGQPRRRSHEDAIKRDSWRGNGLTLHRPLLISTRSRQRNRVRGRIALVGRLMNTPMRYLLVIQFPETFFASHGDLVAFEDQLIASMPRTCDVDGHDIGSGTINFFVYTNAPLAALKHFRKYLGTNKVERNLRVSYREVDGEAFTNLWPFRDPRPFAIIYPEGIDPFSPASKRSIPKRSPPGVSKFETPAASEWPSR